MCCLLALGRDCCLCVVCGAVLVLRIEGLVVAVGLLFVIGGCLLLCDVACWCVRCLCALSVAVCRLLLMFVLVVWCRCCMFVSLLIVIGGWCCVLLGVRC